MSKLIVGDIPDLLPVLLDFFTLSDYSSAHLVSKETNKQIQEQSKFSETLSTVFLSEMKAQFESTTQEKYRAKLELMQKELKVSSRKQNLTLMIKHHVVSANLLFNMSIGLLQSLLNNLEKLVPKPGKVTLQLDTTNFFNSQDQHIKAAIIEYPELLRDEKSPFSLDDVIQMEEEHKTGARLLEAYSKYPNFRTELLRKNKQEILQMEDSALEIMVNEHQLQHNPPVLT